MVKNKRTKVKKNSKSFSGMKLTVDNPVEEDVEVDDGDDVVEINADFTFDDDSEGFQVQNSWNFKNALRGAKGVGLNQTSIDQKIEKQLGKKRSRSDQKSTNQKSGKKDKKVVEDDSSDEDEANKNDQEAGGDLDESDEEEDNENDEDQEESEENEENEVDNSENEEEENDMSEDEHIQEEDEEEEDDFEETNDNDAKSFSELHLSRPFLKACSKLGYEKPTSIQARAIPIGLSGRDICGSAHTGSGKTAAFLLPILERLLYRPKRIPQSRVLVLTPTRELAAQCSSMAENLCQFTDIRVCLVVGGLPTKMQETALRSRPDIIIATPGRLIDHLRNTQSVNLDDIEVLILDEADRLLDMGFTEEVEQVVKCCPKARQTMLFSATMSKKVMHLASISLKEPVYVAVNAQMTVAKGLRQEFIRVKSLNQSDHEAMLIALCKKVFTSKTIVFIQSKRIAHRLRILFGLFKLKATELHGNLTQAQRLEALELFRDEKVNFLIATDVAARGLDIVGIQSVINYQMPRTHSQYIHRVGRTARASKKGVACSFVLEENRLLLKEIVKKSDTDVSQRKIPTELVVKYRKQIDELQDDIDAIVAEEKTERALRIAERDVERAANVIEHQSEIFSRPKKTWFQSETEKKLSKKKSETAVLGSEPEADKPDDNEDEESAEEEEKIHLSKRQLKKKAEKEQEKKMQQKKVLRSKRRRQEAMAVMDAPDVRKAVRSVKSQQKTPKLNTQMAHKKRTVPSNPNGKPPRKKAKTNLYADKKFKKANVEGKFKSQKKYKRR